MATTWYVAYCSVKHEAVAEAGLRAMGLATFLPMRVWWGKRRQRRVENAAPLFPRYLFVGIEGPPRWKPICDVLGIQCILGNEGAARPVESQIVRDLQAAYIAGQFDERSRVDEPRVDASAISPGEMVKIMDGPFTGLLAKCTAVTDDDIGELLISLLGRDVTMKIPLDRLTRCG